MPILEPDLAEPWPTLAGVVAAATWAVFAVDYAVRLVLAGDRWRFVRTNLLDLAVIVLPVLRPLRLLRLVTVLSVLNRRSGHSFRGRVAVYVAAALSLLTFVAGLAVLDAERQAPEANIVDFGDTVWSAMTTATTVGYGDRFPVTTEGRLVGVGLMLAGIVPLGVVTATLASWFVERIQSGDDSTRSDVELLAEEVRRLSDSPHGRRRGLFLLSHMLLARTRRGRSGPTRSAATPLAAPRPGGGTRQRLSWRA